MKSLKATHLVLALTVLSSRFWSLSPLAEKLHVHHDEDIIIDGSGSELKSSKTEEQKVSESQKDHLLSEKNGNHVTQKTLDSHAEEDVDLEQTVKPSGNNAPTTLEDKSPDSVADTGGTPLQDTLQPGTSSETAIRTSKNKENGELLTEDDESANHLELEDDNEMNGEQKEISQHADEETTEDAKTADGDFHPQEMAGKITREAGPTDEIVSEDQPDSAQKLHSSGTRTTTDEAIVIDQSAASVTGAGADKNSTKANLVDVQDSVDTTISDEGLAGPVEEEEEDDDDDEDIRVKAVNYAHKNAGAIILYSSPTFKGTSNLLVSDNDKYAIAPCSDKKSLVLSLSEDILVKVIVLSNFEKYSSSVKEFQVLGTQQYDPGTSKTKWHDLGKYVAQPTSSGEEVFELKEPSWARYLKFRFMTHYGNEHYCTITQIKVHGSTMVQGFHEQYDPWPGVEDDLDGVLEDSSPDTLHKKAETMEATRNPPTAETQIPPKQEEIVVEDKDESPSNGISSEKCSTEEKAATKNVSSNSKNKTSTSRESESSENEESTNRKDTQDGTEEDIKVAPEKFSAEEAASKEDGKVNEKSQPSHENHTTTKMTEAVQAVTNILDTVSSMVTSSLENKTSAVLSNVTASQRLIASNPDDIEGKKQNQPSSSTPTRDSTNEVENKDKASTVDKEATKEKASDLQKESNEISVDEAKKAPTTKESATLKNEYANGNAQSEKGGNIDPPKQTNKQHSSAGAATESQKQMQRISDMIRTLASVDPTLKCLETTKFSDFKTKVQTMIKAAKSKGSGEGSSSGPKMEPIFKTLTDEIKGLQIHVSVYDQFLHELTNCYSQVVVHLTSQTRLLEAEHMEKLARMEQRLLNLEHPERMKQLTAVLTSVRTFMQQILDIMCKCWGYCRHWAYEEVVPQISHNVKVSKKWIWEEAFPMVRHKFEANNSWRDAALVFSGALLAWIVSPLLRLVSTWTMSNNKKVKEENLLPPYSGKVARSKKKKKAKRKVHQVTSDDDESSL